MIVFAAFERSVCVSVVEKWGERGERTRVDVLIKIMRHLRGGEEVGRGNISGNLGFD